jgi:hypothetical protein
MLEAAATAATSPSSAASLVVQVLGGGQAEAEVADGLIVGPGRDGLDASPECDHLSALDVLYGSTLDFITWDAADLSWTYTLVDAQRSGASGARNDANGATRQAQRRTRRR